MIRDKVVEYQGEGLVIELLDGVELKEKKTLAINLEDRRENNTAWCGCRDG